MAREVCAFLKGLQIEITEVKCEISWRPHWPQLLPDPESAGGIHEEVAAEVVEHDGVGIAVTWILVPNHSQRLDLECTIWELLYISLVMTCDVICRSR